MPGSDDLVQNRPGPALGTAANATTEFGGEPNPATPTGEAMRERMGCAGDRDPSSITVPPEPGTARPPDASHDQVDTMRLAPRTRSKTSTRGNTRPRLMIAIAMVIGPVHERSYPAGPTPNR